MRIPSLYPSYHRRAMNESRNGVLLRPKPQVWEMVCGVLGAHTKYLDTYRVLGNQNMQAAIAKRYSQFTDRSYEANVRHINEAIDGLVL